MSRNSHALSTRYNILYNGQIGLDKGMNALKTGDGDNFWRVLAVESMQLKETEIGKEKPKNIDFELAETKATKAIQKHSMNIGGREFNYQTDEAYLLLGKSRYYDQRFVPALDAFNYILYKYPNSNKIYEAKVWREKTNMRLGNDALVIRNINQMLKNEKIKDQPFADAHALLAEAFLNLEQKDSAVVKLKIAEDFTKINQEKARYGFILGQLYQELGKRDSAIIFYDKVIKMKRRAKREYMIQSYARKTQLFDYQNQDKAVFLKVFDDLIKNRENRPFLDVLYYNLGLFYDNNKQDTTAIAHYNTSLRTQPKDAYLSASNYRNIGNVYFKKTNYPTAAKYYDSTLVKLNPKTIEYYKIQKKRKDLDQAIRLETSTKRNDSILKVMALSPSERTNYYEKFILTLKKQDSIKQALEEEEKQKQANINRNLGMPSDDNAIATGTGLVKKPVDLPTNSTQSSNNPSTFYFYNPNTVAFGKLEFKKTFGNRALVENWLFLKANKETILTDSSTNEEEIVATKKEENPRYTTAYYINQLPAKTSEIDSITKARNTDYYELGLVYKEKFKEYELASTKLEQLLTYQPEPKLIPPTRYNLYKIYEIINKTKAEAVKQSIIKEYPDSRYANILTNASTAEDKNSPEAIYNECYKWFEDEKFSTLIQRCNVLINQFTGEEIVAKFELLKANAIGKMQGLTAYKQAMLYVAETYPNTEEGKKAQEIVSTQIPVLEQMTFSTTDTKNWKIIFKIPIEEYQNEQAIEQQVNDFMDKESVAKLYYTCDNYTDKERVFCVHGFRSEIYAKDISAFFNTKKASTNEPKAIPITDKNYSIIQIKKNLDAYLTTKTL